MADVDPQRELKRKKQTKKMTKILSKAWSIDRADPFQEVQDPKQFQSALDGECDSPIDLTSMGQSLDSGTYHDGKKGWEKFSADLGGVYNRFIAVGKKSNLARHHLKEVCELLAKLDPHLSVIAKNSKREVSANPAENNKSPKKRKAVTGADDAQHIPKKKSAKTYDKQDSAPTLSQREDKAMKNLTKHILECGGDEKTLSGVRCKVTQTGDRFQTAYYTGKAQKFKSVTEVAKFLNLTNGSNNSGTQKGKVIVKKSQPRNLRELENERKKITKGT